MQRNILLLHNDALKAAKLQGLLSHTNDAGFAVEWLRTCEAGLRRLNDPTKDSVAAILMDLNLSEGQPLEAFNQLFEASPHVPILVVSAPENESVAKRAVQRGAQDYILENHLTRYALSKALSTMLERAVNAEALFVERERAEVTLNSIGDAVISTDIEGKVRYLNPVAETMTGWNSAEAIGRDFAEVFRIFDKGHPELAVNPMTVAMLQNKSVGLGGNCILNRRDGMEFAIEDSAAPIHDHKGRVTGAVMVFHDVTQTRAITQRMSHLAYHDYLTELPNRLLLDDRLAQAMSAARRHKQLLAVLFVDVDRFKHINDSLGHTIGDELLLSIARRLVENVRSSDTVSRQGGDEFVVLLSRIGHAEDAARSANKILSAVGLPHHVQDHDLQVTVSVGIGIYPDDGTDAETLVKNADIAMLNAKENGRNNYQFFTPMTEHAKERRALEGGLRQALEKHEFVLHYQPKMNLEAEAITGVEALIRWRQPGVGIVMPEKFIRLAEECGFIVPIGRWVLREACHQIQRWLDAGFPPLSVAINVSAVELRSKDFLEGVRAILKDTGVSPHYLEFELTETALIQDPQSIILVLNSLKEMGIKLALDDFGTGYSSLSYLKRFPIDALKIDKSFVCGLCTNAEDANIVSAVIYMGKNFGLKVIAEGVETRDQFLKLQVQQCTEGQGYYFQEPIAGEEFSKLLGSDLSATIVA